MSKQKQFDNDTSNDFYFDDPESTPMINKKRSEASSRGMREGGEEAAEQPKEEEKKEEDKKEDEKPPSGDRPEPDEEKDFVDCLGCCKCQCHDPVSREESCYCCCPLRCGVYAIGSITILLFLSRLFTIVFDFGNIYFDWWFNFINLLLIIPIAVAIVFFISFCLNDSKEARQKLWIGQLMVIGSIFLLCLWAIIYVAAVYKYQYVYLGSGPEEEYQRLSKQYSNYMDEEKNGFILAECFWLLIEGALWGYFAYVCYKYDDTYYPKEDEAAEEEPKKEEEKKEEEKKEE